MDLRVDKPRAGSESLGEWAWLPRMIDKARATYQGHPGTYSHPCGRDRMLLSQMGITADEFREIIERTTTDDQVLAELEAMRAEKGAD